jgi:mutator protein MutT
MVIAVCAAVIRRGNKLLVTQRRRDQTHPLRWEFPGGHLDTGESGEACVKREIKEELGIRVSSSVYYCTLRYSVSGKSFIIRYFLCKVISGRIRKLEVENFKWIVPEKFDDRVLLQPDRQVLRWLMVNSKQTRRTRKF